MLLVGACVIVVFALSWLLLFSFVLFVLSLFGLEVPCYHFNFVCWVLGFCYFCYLFVYCIWGFCLWLCVCDFCYALWRYAYYFRFGFCFCFCDCGFDLVWFVGLCIAYTLMKCCLFVDLLKVVLGTWVWYCFVGFAVVLVILCICETVWCVWLIEVGCGICLLKRWLLVSCLSLWFYLIGLLFIVGCASICFCLLWFDLLLIAHLICLRLAWLVLFCCCLVWFCAWLVVCCWNVGLLLGVCTFCASALYFIVLVVGGLFCAGWF